MSRSVRKRKSLWDSKEETQLPAEIIEKTAWHGRESYSSLHGNDKKCLELDANDVWEPKDGSGWLSWEEPSQGNNGQKDDSISRGLNEIPKTTRALSRDKSCDIYPGFDGLEEQNISRLAEKSWAESRRYRKRSRSRSRSRGRGRSRSRSGSRGWDRDGSRSRSWSRSPLYRHESYGWSDRHGSRLSSQICREFAVGKCRRGSQCRFLHQDSLNHRDGGRSENDRSQRWRRRQGSGEALDYAYDEGPRDYPRDKISDGYGNYYDRERGESRRSSSKSTIPCDDFLKGSGYRGSSHHGGSGVNYERGNRSTSFVHHHKRHPGKNSSIPCKFFAMGKCQRDDCRFSHDGAVYGNREGRSLDDRFGHNLDDEKKSWNGPKWGAVHGNRDGAAYGNSEGRSLDDRFGHNLDDEKKSWNGPKWGDTNGVSDVAKSTGRGNSNAGNANHTVRTTAEKWTEDRWGHILDDENKPWNGPKWGEATDVSGVKEPSGWGNSNAGNVNFADPTTVEKPMDERWDHSLDDQSRMCGSSPWKDKAAVRDEYPSPRLGNGSSDANMSITESTGVAKLLDKEECPLISQSLQSETLDGIAMHVHEQNTAQEDLGQQLAATVMHPVVSGNSNIQLHCMNRRDGVSITDCSYAFNKENASGSTMFPVLVPAQSFNQSCDSLGSLLPSSCRTDRSQHVISLNSSNGLSIGPNEPVQQLFSPLNLQDQTQIHHEESVKILQMPEFKIPQVNSEIPQASEQLAQRTNLPASLTQMFGNEQLPQLYAILNPPDPTRLVPSLSNSATLVPPMASMDGQPDPARRSLGQYDHIGDSIKSSKPGNSNGPDEGKKPMPLEQLSASSNGKPVYSKIQKHDGSEEEYQESLNLNLQQEKPISNSEVEENNKLKTEKCKQDQETNHQDNVDACVRVEEGNGGKDEKEMRLFKNTLVEFVKEILKPTWKEGQMSREVHKTIVKKVVDKVLSTIQGPNFPKTQDQIDQYLSYSKPKLTKLVQAYVERFMKS